jgi:hypothetical protein
VAKEENIRQKIWWHKIKFGELREIWWHKVDKEDLWWTIRNCVYSDHQTCKSNRERSMLKRSDRSDACRLTVESKKKKSQRNPKEFPVLWWETQDDRIAFWGME